MKIVCWNINNFSKDKVQNPQQWEVIDHVIRSADLTVILEGRYKKLSRDQLGNALASKLDGFGIQACPTAAGEEGECESIFFIWDPKTVALGKGAPLTIHGAADIRAPIVIPLKGYGHQAKGSVVFKLVAWHAPPHAKGPSKFFPAFIKAASADSDIKLLMGDFNSPFDSDTSPFKKVSKGDVTMLDLDVNAVPTDCKSAWGTTSNDHIFIRDKFEYSAAHHCGRLNTLKLVPSWRKYLERQENELNEQLMQIEGDDHKAAAERLALKQLIVPLVTQQKSILKATSKLAAEKTPELVKVDQTGLGKRGRGKEEDLDPNSNKVKQIGKMLNVGTPRPVRGCVLESKVLKSPSEAYKVAKAVSDHVPMMIVV